MGLFSLCFILRELDSVLPEIRLGAISPTRRERNAGFGGRMGFEESCSVVNASAMYEQRGTVVQKYKILV